MSGCPFGYCLGGDIGGFGGTDDNAAAVEEHCAGWSECNLARSAVQKHHAEPSFDGLDGLRERRL